MFGGNGSPWSLDSLPLKKLSAYCQNLQFAQSSVVIRPKLLILTVATTKKTWDGTRWAYVNTG